MDDGVLGKVCEGSCPESTLVNLSLVGTVNMGRDGLAELELEPAQLSPTKPWRQPQVGSESKTEDIQPAKN